MFTITMTEEIKTLLKPFLAYQKEEILNHAAIACEDGELLASICESLGIDPDIDPWQEDGKEARAIELECVLGSLDVLKDIYEKENQNFLTVKKAVSAQQQMIEQKIIDGILDSESEIEDEIFGSEDLLDASSVEKDSELWGLSRDHQHDVLAYLVEILSETKKKIYIVATDTINHTEGYDVVPSVWLVYNPVTGNADEWEACHRAGCSHVGHSPAWINRTIENIDLTGLVSASDAEKRACLFYME